MTVRAVASGKGRVRTGRVGAQGPDGGGGVSPAFQTDFTAISSLPTGVSLTRSTTGTRFNSSGVLVTEAIDAPRFDYAWNGSAWVAAGLLIEEQRTNIIFPSIPGGIWNSSNTGTATGASGTSPDGTNDAVKITSSAGSGTYRGLYASTTGITNGTSYTFSAFAKSNGVQWIILDLYDGANQDVWFDLTNGIVGGASAGSTGTIQNIGNGWYRVTHTRTATPSNILLPGLYPADANNSATFTSTGSNGPLVFGAQMEAGPFATSYIPTTTAAVTRSADVVQLTGAALAALQGAAYSIVLQTYNYNPKGFGCFIGIDNSGNGVIRVFAASDTQVAAEDAGQTTNLVATIGGGGNATAPVRIAYGTSSSGASLVANNGTLATNGLQGNNTGPFYLGSAFGTEYLNAHFTGLAIYSSRLPDATLQAKSVVGAAF
jgi:hypothetical protein